MQKTRRALFLSVTIFGSIIVLGSFGFMLVEPTLHNDYSKALWLTIVTVMTVGYGDVVPMTDAGRAIAAFVMLAGVGAGIYTMTLLFQLVVTDKLRFELGLPARRTRMKGHYIVGGYGMVGRQVVEQLQCHKESFVIIEKDRDKIESLVDKGFNVIHGDAEDEETLIKANISDAKALITTMRDNQNMVSIIAARSLNPSLFIVSEVEESKNVGKLRNVGADLTINCHEMGARIIVENARHAVVDPVCEIEMSEIQVQIEYVHDGVKFSFCSKECMEAFKAHPERFLKSRQFTDVCPIPRK